MRRHGIGGAALLGLALGPFICSSSAPAQTIVQQAQLLPAGTAGDRVGTSLAVGGATLVVGAPFDNVGANGDQGAAYVYVLTGNAWVLQARLLASDGAAGDQFGQSVAVDGDTIIVGAPYDDVGGIVDQGSAYVFVRSGTTWTEQQRLTVAGAAVDMFGWSVAVSGDRVLVGAPLDDVGASENQGTAFSFTRSHGVWSLEDTFKGGGAQERNGYSVALSGTVAAIGAPMATANAHAEQGVVRLFAYVAGSWTGPVTVTPAAGAANDRFGVSVDFGKESLIAGAYQRTVAGHTLQGAAYVFTAGPAGWAEQAILASSDGASGDLFGVSVAIDGDTALVGAPQHDPGGSSNQGSAYVFTRSGSAWTERARLNGAGGAASDDFGRSVALVAGVAIAGAPLDNVGPDPDEGSVTVFTGAGTAWTRVASLTGVGAEESWFGEAVDVHYDTAIVGASYEDVGANARQGAAYVFVRNGLTWSLQARLVAGDGAAEQHFGASVAVEGDIAIVGTSPLNHSGAAYVFVRSAGTWAQQAKLTAPVAGSNFGSAVALSGTTAVVGAPWEPVDGSLRVGAAYVFVRSGTSWPQQARLAAGEGAEFDLFGGAVSVSGNTALIGADQDYVGPLRSGSAYVFVRSGTSWSQQAQLVATDGNTNWLFGEAVAVSGDAALVGAPGAPGGGAAYAFSRSGTTWTQQEKLVPEGTDILDAVGKAVALSGEMALVGAQGRDVDGASAKGAAFAYVHQGGSWVPVGTLTHAGGGTSDQFGTSVALHGDLAVAGAPFDTASGLGTGSAAVFSGLCQFTITPSAIAPSAASGSQFVTVDAAQSVCAWSTSSQAAWLTVDPPATGTGDGAVTIRYTANTGPARTGTMTIAGETFTVNQAGGCTFTLGATAAPSGAVGGNGGVSFTASHAACPWTAASNVPWMSVTPPDTGTGSGAIAYAVLPNAGPARSGTLTIAGQTFTVNQEGGCSFSLTPSSATAVAAGGTSTIQVSASDAACAWSASSNVAWLSAPLGNGGVGSATFTWAAAGNLGPARAGTMTIAGLTFTVNQANGCTYFVTPEDVSVSALGGFASLALVASDGACPWTAVSNVTWAAISSAPSGTGSATVNVAVEPNTGAARSGTLTVAGRTIDVVQAAWGCTFAVTPLAIDAPAAGLSGTVSITAAHPACAWTVGSAPDWISFPAGSSGSGSATLAYHVAANYTSTQRQAAFSVGGQVVSVTQAGSGCGFSVSPTALAFPVNATTRTLASSARDAGCAWTAATASAWLVVSPASGTGAGTVTVLATANDDTARTGSVEVAGSTVSVQQDGSATPSGAMTRYLAEGATTDFFDMRISLLNTGNGPDTVTLRYLTRDGATPSQSVTVPPLTRATVWPETLLGAAEFSTVVESSGPIVVDRTMQWDTRGYGSHAETAVAGPALEWFLAEGATHSGFDLFYLVQNPNAAPAEVEVRYLRPAPQPQLTRTYTVNPNTRFNIWVDYEDPALADTDLSAVVRSINGQPIIVERAMYKSVPGHFFNAGHESAGITSPATRWLLAEGATGPYFDLFVLLANPDVRAADVRVTYLLPDGTTYTKTMTLPGESRSNIWVDYDTPDGTTGLPLNDTAVSTTVEVTNGVPIIVERAMWWPTGPATWFEAHNSAGATAAGTRWALAEGEAGGPNATETYILIANTSPAAGEALVTLLFEDGTSAHRTYALPALSRTNVPVLFDFPQSAGRRFGAIVETLGETPAQIVVERAVYSDAEGIHWAAGSNALATRLR